MPIVSVIVPVYNVERYLEECLDSIINQTLKDIEVICIDDGSTDNSLSILKRYAVKDKRIVILQQENQGAGVARNIGMSVAKGKYLSFLDGDDFFVESLLEDAVLQAEKEQSDIVIFKYVEYDHQKNNYGINEKGINLNHSFDTISNCIFNKNDIFNLTNPAPWNKLYRHDFVERNNLYFQDNKRTNDLYFTCAALACAQRITLLNKVLAFYRVGMSSNSQATNYVAPLDFYKALNGLKEFLVHRELFDELNISYSNLCVSICRYNIYSNNLRSRIRILKMLREYGFKELSLDEKAIKRIEKAKFYKLGKLLLGYFK